VAVQFLKSAIGNLEDEMDSEFWTLGSRSWLDRHPAHTMSFDPPSLRPKNFAYFKDVSAGYSGILQNGGQCQGNFGSAESNKFDTDANPGVIAAETAAAAAAAAASGGRPPLQLVYPSHGGAGKGGSTQGVVMNPANPKLREDTLVIGKQSRAYQEKLVMLTRLYELFMQVSLNVVKNVPMLLGIPILYKLPRSGVNKKFNETIYENISKRTAETLKKCDNDTSADQNVLKKEKSMPGHGTAKKRKSAEPINYNPTKLAISTQEADVVSEFGENPYLRCLFFVAIAKRHPRSSNLALAKAMALAERADKEETALWEFFEPGMMRDQDLMMPSHNEGCEVEEDVAVDHHHFGYNSINIPKAVGGVPIQTAENSGAGGAGGMFGGSSGLSSTLKKKSRKPKARDPVLFARTPRTIWLRMPATSRYNAGERDAATNERLTDGASTSVYNQTEPRVWSNLRTTASRIEIRELKKQNLVCGIVGQTDLTGVHSQLNSSAGSGTGPAETFVLYGKEAGVGTSVSSMHKSLENTGGRLAGYDYIAVGGLCPNVNYAFAAKETRGFDIGKGADVELDKMTGLPKSSMGLTSATTPAIGTYFTLPVSVLWLSILEEGILLEEDHRGLEAQDNSFLERNAEVQKEALGKVLSYFSEPCSGSEKSDLRGRKLRLDVVERNPPYVLARFAQALIVRQRLSSGCSNLRKNAARVAEQKGRNRPNMNLRGAQLKLLAEVDEVMLALDAANRAAVMAVRNRDGASAASPEQKSSAEHQLDSDTLTIAMELILQAVSLLLEKLKVFLQYRTRPEFLFEVLVQCVWSLENVDLRQWDPQCRRVAVFLFHQLVHVSVLLRKNGSEVTQSLLNSDKIERYAMLAQKKMAEAAESDLALSSGNSMGSVLEILSARNTVARVAGRPLESAPGANLLAEDAGAREASSRASARRGGSADVGRSTPRYDVNRVAEHNYSVSLAFLCLELGFLNLSVAPERVSASLGAPFMCVNYADKVPTYGASSGGAFCVDELTGLFGGLAKPGETDFAPNYFDVAKNCALALVEKGHPLGVPVAALCLARVAIGTDVGKDKLQDLAYKLVFVRFLWT